MEFVLNKSSGIITVFYEVAHTCNPTTLSFQFENKLLSCTIEQWEPPGVVRRYVGFCEFSGKSTKIKVTIDSESRNCVRNEIIVWA